MDADSAAIITRLLDKVDALERELRGLRARVNGESVPAVDCSPVENMEFVELTPAQYAVAECIIEGMSTPRIAVYLKCAESTVKTHRRAIRKAVGESECEELKALKSRWFHAKP